MPFIQLAKYFSGFSSFSMDISMWKLDSLSEISIKTYICAPQRIANSLLSLDYSAVSIAVASRQYPHGIHSI